MTTADTIWDNPWKTTFFFRWLVTLMMSSVMLGADSLPKPASDGFDWVQMKNGELIKGEIEGFEGGTLTIDSDNFDLLDIDINDIHSINTTGVNTYVFTDGTSVLGRLELVGDNVTVRRADEYIAKYKRDELMELIQGGESEWDYWTFRFSLGTTYRQGNTDQVDSTGFFEVERRTPQLRTRLEYRASYGEVENVKTVDNQTGSFRQDIFLDPQWYLILPSVQYYKDKIQNIEHRVTPGFGMGYEIFNTSKLEWDVLAGAGYQWTKFSVVEPGQSSTDAGGAILAATDLEWELTKNVDWDFTYNTSIGLASGMGIDHHIKTGFSFDLWRDLEFDVSLLWDHIGQPQKNEDGTYPDSDDTVMYFGIGWNM